MKRHIITVDQAAIRRGSSTPIHVLDTETGRRENYSQLHVNGPVVFRYDPDGLSDGARVWAETDATPLGVVQCL